MGLAGEGAGGAAGAHLDDLVVMDGDEGGEDDDGDAEEVPCWRAG